MEKVGHNLVVAIKGFRHVERIERERLRKG